MFGSYEGRLVDQAAAASSLDTTQVPTLVVADFASRCSACGKDSRLPADLDSTADHLCGTRFEAVAVAADANLATEGWLRQWADRWGLPYVGRRPWPRPSDSPSPAQELLARIQASIDAYQASTARVEPRHVVAVAERLADTEFARGEAFARDGLDSPRGERLRRRAVRQVRAVARLAAALERGTGR